MQISYSQALNVSPAIEAHSVQQYLPWRDTYEQLLVPLLNDSNDKQRNKEPPQLFEFKKLKLGERWHQGWAGTVWGKNFKLLLFHETVSLKLLAKWSTLSIKCNFFIDIFSSFYLSIKLGSKCAAFILVTHLKKMSKTIFLFLFLYFYFYLSFIIQRFRKYTMQYKGCEHAEPVIVSEDMSRDAACGERFMLSAWHG